MRDYAIVFGVAFATVLATTPMVRRLCVLVGAVDRPGGRRVNLRPTPRLGGIGLLAGFLAAVAAASQLPTFAAVFETTSDPEAVVLAALVVFAVGLIDDVRGVSAPAKLAGQILAAGTLVLFGVILRFVYVPGELGIIVLSSDFGALFTIVAIVAMINAVNLVDGLDGLAAGIVGIAAAALFAYVQFGDRTFTLGTASSAELVLVAVLGVCAAFLVFNFHPASIFMGDSGALLLGLLLGGGGVLAVGQTVMPSGRDFAALSIPILVPVLVLAIPFVDTSWTILRRLLTGRAVFSPDKLHLHHRLIEIGHSHRRAVLIMYYWSALLAFAAVAVGLLPRDLVVVVLTVGVGLGAVTLLAARVRSLARRGRHVRAENFVLSFTRPGARKAKTTSEQGKRIQRRL